MKFRIGLLSSICLTWGIFFSSPQVTAQFGTQGIIQEAQSPLNLDMKLGDMDGDGDLDCVQSTFFMDRIVCLYNNGKGEFDRHEVLAQNIQSQKIFLADVDEDGQLDVICSSAREREVLFLSNKNGQWEKK